MTRSQNNPAVSQTVTERHGFIYLLAFLLIYLFGSPFLTSFPQLEFIAHASLTITLIISAFILQRQQHRRAIGVFLLIPVIVLYWLDVFSLSPATFVSYLLFAVYFCLLIATYVKQIALSGAISVNVLCAALSLYLILGLLWGVLYAVLNELSPGSYSGALLSVDQGNSLTVYTYFSLVTLTTLGYGDITPQTPAASALCQMEAITGQFFTAVVVAWLVGKFVANNEK